MKGSRYMKLKDLLQLSFINDDTVFKTVCQITATVRDVRRGNWFQDHILDLMEYEVKNFTYTSEFNQLKVDLTFPMN